MLRSCLSSIDACCQSLIVQCAERGQCEMTPRRVNPAQTGQILCRLVYDTAKEALQGFRKFQSNKSSCHAENNIASSSEPSIVSPSMRCSAMTTSLSFFSRKILSAVL